MSEPTTEGDVLEELVKTTHPRREPVTTAPKLADGLPVSRKTVLQRLGRLEARGDVGRMDVGGRATVWWPLTRELPPEEHPDQRGLDELDQGDRDEHDRREPESERRPEQTRLDADADPIDDVLARFRPGRGAGDRREAQREAARAALTWLRDRNGPATGSEFQDALLPEHAIDGQSPTTFWRKTVRPALKLAVDDELVTYREGHHDYEWTEQ